MDWNGDVGQGPVRLGEHLGMDWTGKTWIGNELRGLASTLARCGGLVTGNAILGAVRRGMDW